MTTFKIAQLITVLTTPTAWAFITQHQLLPSTLITRTSPTAICLDLGGFFLSKKNQDNNNSNDGPSTRSDKNEGDLGGIAEIMDSMDNLESAQRAGKLTTSLLQELQSTMVEGSAEDGKVKVFFDCQQRPVRVSIDEGYYAEASASDMAVSLTMALQDGHEKSIQKTDETLTKLYSEFGLSQS